MTLLCWSGGWRDTFLLAKEGASELLLYVKVNKTEEITQGQFSFYSVTSAHGGTYRCYSLHNNTPYWLSNPSAPLQLWVSGKTQFCPLHHDQLRAQRLCWDGEKEVEWSMWDLPSYSIPPISEPQCTRWAGLQSWYRRRDEGSQALSPFIILFQDLLVTAQQYPQLMWVSLWGSTREEIILQTGRC